MRTQICFPEIRGRTVIADPTIGEQGKGFWRGGVHQLSASHADTAAAIGMIHEDELAVVGFGLFQWGELIEKALLLPPCPRPWARGIVAGRAETRQDRPPESLPSDLVLRDLPLTPLANTSGLSKTRKT